MSIFKNVGYKLNFYLFLTLSSPLRFLASLFNLMGLEDVSIKIFHRFFGLVWSLFDSNEGRKSIQSHSFEVEDRLEKNHKIDQNFLLKHPLRSNLTTIRFSFQEIFLILSQNSNKNFILFSHCQ
jgi:hypothetical protein